MNWFRCLINNDSTQFWNWFHLNSLMLRRHNISVHSFGSFRPFLWRLIKSTTTQKRAYPTFNWVVLLNCRYSSWKEVWLLLDPLKDCFKWPITHENSLACSLAYWLTLWLTGCLLSNALRNHSLIDYRNHSFIYSRTHSFTYFFSQYFLHSHFLTHSLTHSLALSHTK